MSNSTDLSRSTRRRALPVGLMTRRHAIFVAPEDAKNFRDRIAALSAALVDGVGDDDDDDHDHERAKKIVEDGTEGQDSKICSQDEGNSSNTLSKRDVQEEKEI
mmetsp:Transcript_10746/g.14874  ORF Transcript_10746/g.14874 Transcript_10746/m.14874 type:complete len:104 (-) Transcript_10746:537-848(-)|eukprot:CAMPEP_0185256444 /NCGR_PEP_ID=MMETSP1359-20130426/5555_1 /TAXON_ID=552665 /ORGANISM="Bigelowiella longifila, Strain CCMP242" /LENGTH=103 /DNA_ID=CAMNT_0027841029 /DNA_START=61 /DNA_END=372 /DNA_ORIENTATION=-